MSQVAQEKVNFYCSIIALVMRSVQKALCSKGLCAINVIQAAKIALEMWTHALSAQLESICIREHAFHNAHWKLLFLQD